jgi:hypothetical protein
MRLMTFVLICFLVCGAFPALSDDSLSFTGNLSIPSAVWQESDSVEEDPDLLEKVKIDAGSSAWSFHSWLDGGWMGVQRSRQGVMTS